MKYLVLAFFFTQTFNNSSMAQKSPDTHKRYTKVPAGFLMVLRQDDDVLAKIKDLAITENIPSANFTGMGFVDATFGYFDTKTKKYTPKQYKAMELASMTGSIAWQNDTVSLHTHGVVTDKNFQSYGGHMLAAKVGTGSVEILVTVHDQKLERILEQPLGANVLSLDTAKNDTESTNKYIQVKGVVQSIQQGKDGYTAKVLATDKKFYFVTISHANLKEHSQYKTFKIGDKVDVSGDSFHVGEEIHMAVRAINQ